MGKMRKKNFAECQAKTCNNYDNGKCIALSEKVKRDPCPFYCSIMDTKPEDVKYHRESISLKESESDY